MKDLQQQIDLLQIMLRHKRSTQHVRLHLYGVQNQAKLIYDFKSHNMVTLEGDRDKEVIGKASGGW
jgi:hypothetical protein